MIWLMIIRDCTELPMTKKCREDKIFQNKDIRNSQLKKKELERNKLKRKEDLKWKEGLSSEIKLKKPWFLREKISQTY